MLKLTIHKGTNEIGGSCIELSTDNTTILLDYGTPLNPDSQPVTINHKVDAIVISHPHQDHYGQINVIDTAIPVYCGELSLELMNATQIFTGKTQLDNNFHHYSSWKKFSIGDFTITPYLVDHSAVDAHALLIEAEGKRVLYSGDFRATGRKSKLFDKLINNKKLKGVDLLLMEGTMLQRSNDDFPDEQSVEDTIYQTIKKSKLISFMIGSSQNIDSIVSAYRACKRNNKIFVIDLYTAWILEKLKLVSASVPNMHWDDVKVVTKLGGYYYEKMKDNQAYFSGFYNEVFNHKVDINDIRNHPERYFLKVSPKLIERYIEELAIDKANIIYSQWLGYMDTNYNSKNQVDLFERLKNQYHWVYAHTSGHADLKVLKQFATAIAPKTLIPIHTEYKCEFIKHFNNVIILNDDEVFDLNKGK